MGRRMADEVGAVAYYEASVLEHYGINQVFINVTRAALVNRREKHFWNMLGYLKRVSKPICQVCWSNLRFVVKSNADHPRLVTGCSELLFPFPLPDV